MKRFIIFMLTIVLCLGVSLTAFAEEKEVTIDASQPRLMVTDYKVDGGCIKPSKKTSIKITFKNYSKTKSLSNVKLSLCDEGGGIETVGMANAYVDRIYAGATYVWKLDVKANKTAEIGEHKLTVSAEYEDKYFNAYNCSDTISVMVKQSVGLSYDGLRLATSVVQGDTETLTVNLMNTGKTDLRNCKIDFDVKGLESGGTLFVGEIAAGENKEASANLRVSSDVLGDAKGTAKISYEDAYGKAHSKEVNLSTSIEKRVEHEEVVQEEEKAKYPLWWLFMIVGIAAGGAVGFIIPTMLHKSKQRKQDELRL